MKKEKVTLGLLTGALSVMALAACDAPIYNYQGYILTYVNAQGETMHYSAEDLFGTYLNDSSSVSTMFQKTYELVVRNYYLVEPGQEGALQDCEDTASARLTSLKDEAEDNASANGTSYDEEFANTLDSYGATNEDDLYQVLLYQAMEEDFEEKFYDDNIDHLRDSRTDDADGDGYEGYLEAKVPYHVSHILVNVDAASGAHYNGTISEDNARKLYSVANELANSKRSFGSIAQIMSDDTGSATNYGELGIMDKDTSYINEFKLGVYAYEEIYNSTTSDAASQSAIGIDEETKKALKDATNNQTISTIPYGAFLKLNDYAEIVTGYNNTEVNNGDAEYYPRNVLFNKYFNKHNVSVITPNDIDNAAGTVNAGAINGENEVGEYNATFAEMAGFKVVDGLDVNGDSVVNDLDKVLCTTAGDPILVVRGGTEGDSSYQGLHFIVINRSPFEEDDVSLSNYYTTYYPGHADYPVDQNGNPLRTYVNFFDQPTSDNRSRAETVYNAITGFDDNIDHYIFEKYFESEKIQFNDEKIGNAITNWIESSRVTLSMEEEQTWNETWRTYIEYLEQQTSERSKNLPEVCAIQYNLSPEERNSELWAEGGLCDDRR